MRRCLILHMRHHNFILLRFSIRGRLAVFVLTEIVGTSIVVVRQLLTFGLLETTLLARLIFVTQVFLTLVDGVGVVHVLTLFVSLFSISVHYLFKLF